MNYKSFNITIDEMNSILSYVKVNNKMIVYTDKVPDDIMQNIAFINIGMVNISVATEYKGKKLIYRARLDNVNKVNTISGTTAFCTLKKYITIPTLYCKSSAKAILGFNPKYYGKRIENAVGYDLNSAYSSAMLKGWIDTTTKPMQKVVKRNEVGFSQDLHSFVNQGSYSFYVFKKAPVPDGVKKFIDKYYEKKINAETPEDKARAKMMLNGSIGYMQKVNPFLRALIINTCNDYIESLLDTDSIYWNTDSIVSARWRPDIESKLGTGVGEWKIEHEGAVAQKGYSIQWNNEAPVYRGISKTAFGKEFDLLTDEVKKISNNIYTFNKKELKIEKNL